MKIKKTVNFKLKHILPVLTIAGASLCAGCKKSEPDIIQHDTTYYWGIKSLQGEDHNLNQIYDPETRGATKQVIASADSAEVRYVICYHLDEYLGGAPDSQIRPIFERIQNGIPEENRSKIRGGGELRGLGVHSPADSLWLTQLGFKIVDSYCNYQH